MPDDTKPVSELKKGDSFMLFEPVDLKYLKVKVVSVADKLVGGHTKARALILEVDDGTFRQRPKTIQRTLKSQHQVRTVP